jgi:hypothetical protein
MEHRNFQFQNEPNKRLKFNWDRGLMSYLLDWALNIYLCVHYVHSSGQIMHTCMLSHFFSRTPRIAAHHYIRRRKRSKIIMLSHFKLMHISSHRYPCLSPTQANNNSYGWESVLVHWSHTYFPDRLGWHQKSCKCLATDNQETGSCVIYWCYKIQWDTMEV